MKLFLALLLLIAACEGKPLERMQSGNPEYVVELLFEHEGCRVYRFLDGAYRYFTNCSGSTQWSAGKRHDFGVAGGDP